MPRNENEKADSGPYARPITTTSVKDTANIFDQTSASSANQPAKSSKSRAEKMQVDKPDPKASVSVSAIEEGLGGLDFEDDEIMMKAEVKKTRTFAQHGDAFLIADPDQDNPGVVHYRTREEYEEIHGDKKASELDELCILIKDDDGNYLPKPQYYSRIDVRDVDGGKDKKTEARKERFIKKMKELGLTTKTHAKLEYFGKVKQEEATYDTPGGKRERSYKYEHPVRAGEGNPDIMVRTKEGLVGLYPSKDSNLKGKSLKELKEIFNGSDFHIKSTDNVYHSAKNYAAKYGERSVEKRLAYFNGTELSYNPTLPKVLVRVGEKYFDLDLARKQYPESRQVRAANEGRKNADLLVLTKGGAGYVSPAFLHWSDKAHFTATMDEAKIPSKVRYASRPETSPNVLVQVGRGSFVQGSETVDKRNGKTLKDAYTDTRVFVQTKNRYGEASGAFKILAEYERGGHEVTKEMSKELGIAERTTEYKTRPTQDEVSDTRRRSEERGRDVQMSI